MNYKSVTARWNVQQQRCFSQKHQLATAKYLGCSSKIMEQGTLTWTNLKNNLSQLGSIPAINKTTLKPPNTHTHIYIYICISDERGHGILIFSQKHFFGNFLQKVTSSILHFFLRSHRFSCLQIDKQPLQVAICEYGKGNGTWGLFFGHRLVEVYSLLNHGNLTNRGGS